MREVFTLYLTFIKFCFSSLEIIIIKKIPTPLSLSGSDKFLLLFLFISFFLFAWSFPSYFSTIVYFLFSLLILSFFPKFKPINFPSSHPDSKRSNSKLLFINVIYKCFSNIKSRRIDYLFF